MLWKSIEVVLWLLLKLTKMKFLSLGLWIFMKKMKKYECNEELGEYVSPPEPQGHVTNTREWKKHNVIH